MPRHALVVEDERLVRLVLVEMLEELGWSVLAAASAEGARGAAARLPKLDLAVVDAGLAARGGPGEWLRHLRPHTGTLFVSGSPPRVLDVLPSRRIAFLQKPFGTAELEAAVASLRGRRTRALTTVYTLRRDRHTPHTPAGALASNDRKDRPREEILHPGRSRDCGEPQRALPGRRPRLASVLLRKAPRGAAANRAVAPLESGLGLPAVSD